MFVQLNYYYRIPRLVDHWIRSFNIECKIKGHNNNSKSFGMGEKNRVQFDFAFGHAEQTLSHTISPDQMVSAVVR